MIRLLVTGMSGIGKSALLAELPRRGYRAVDIDYGGFGVRVGDETQWREERGPLTLRVGIAPSTASLRRRSRRTSR